MPLDGGISFAARNDVLFCSVLSGQCLLIRALEGPIKLSPGDFVLIRASKLFSFASDAKVRPADSDWVFGADKEMAVLWVRATEPTSPSSVDGSSLTPKMRVC